MSYSLHFQLNKETRSRVETPDENGFFFVLNSLGIDDRCFCSGLMTVVYTLRLFFAVFSLRFSEFQVLVFIREGCIIYTSAVVRFGAVRRCSRSLIANQRN